MGLRVGIDLVSVGDVEASIDRYAERYLNRVYTPDELSECRATDGTLVTERLATRFAAKEALLKALRTDDEAIPWSDVAVYATWRSVSPMTVRSRPQLLSPRWAARHERRHEASGARRDRGARQASGGGVVPRGRCGPVRRRHDLARQREPDARP